jgi:hypothetical protein
MTMAQSFANAGPRDHRCHEGARSSGTRAKAPLGSSTSRRSLGVSRTSNWSISLSDRELGGGHQSE